MIDRQEWLEARRKGIGGTDAAAILGLSPYRSAIDVWEDKLGLAPERPQTAAMRWGLLLEDAVAGAYAEETGRPVRKVPMRRAKHVDSFPMIGSIDRMAIDRTTFRGAPVASSRVVELKTTRSSDGYADKDDWRDVEAIKRIPPAHYVQVQHYLELTRLDIADVAVLIGGSDFRIFEIPRDPEFGADLVDEMASFWTKYVETGTQPPVGPDDGAFLARKYPRSLEDEKVATAEVSIAVDRWLEIEGTKELLETEQSTIRSVIEDYLGTAGRLVTGSATVSWKSHDRTSTSWKEVAGVLRRIVDRAKAGDLRDLEAVDLDAVESLYARTSPVRPFLVNRKQEV